MTNYWDWASFFEQEVAATFAIALENHEDKSREGEIDLLLRYPLEQAFLIIVQSVPAMNDDDWMDFQYRLARRIPTDEQAKTLLKMARMMVEAENEIRSIVNLHTIAEAVEIINDISQTRDYAELFTLMAFLYYLSKIDSQAHAIWEYVSL